MYCYAKSLSNFFILIAVAQQRVPPGSMPVIEPGTGLSAPTTKQYASALVDDGFFIYLKYCLMKADLGKKGINR
jgi:hypothetical protein